jgi:hypothetical protein
MSTIARWNIFVMHQGTLNRYLNQLETQGFILQEMIKAASICSKQDGIDFGRSSWLPVGKSLDRIDPTAVNIG